jgi:hypothetical protein
LKHPSSISFGVALRSLLEDWVNFSCPKHFNGLGLPDLRIFGTALRLRWLWLACIDQGRTWVSFQFSVDRNTQAFFDASVTVEIRDGARVLFWEDNWLAGCSIKSLAPNLWAAFLPTVRRSHTVKDALSVGHQGLIKLGHRCYARADSSGSHPVPHCLGSRA